MRNEIFLAVLGLVLVTLFCSGCTGNNAEPQQTITPTPVSTSVELHKQGFDAYVRGENPLALDLYNQAIAADPSYTRAWMDKGDVLKRMNRSEEAVAAYDVVLARQNDLPIVWNSRGESLMETGNYTAARDSFIKAIQIASDFEKAKENRDLAIEKIKEAEQAGAPLDEQV
jgi:tetratricopeptide (TPR) repeat protein